MRMAGSGYRYMFGRSVGGSPSRGRGITCSAFAHSCSIDGFQVRIRRRGGEMYWYYGFMSIITPILRQELDPCPDELLVELQVQSM